MSNIDNTFDVANLRRVRGHETAERAARGHPGPAVDETSSETSRHAHRTMRQVREGAAHREPARDENPQLRPPSSTTTILIDDYDTYKATVHREDYDVQGSGCPVAYAFCTN